MHSVTKLMIGVLSLSACTDTDSTTNLNPAGPPMLRQVRLNHRVFDANGNSQTRRVFGFGSHELASVNENQSGLVTDALVVNNTFRLIFDELLVGNNLEEIACRAPVRTSARDPLVQEAFSRIPTGATPDDVARCAVADDALPVSCGGPTAMCLCEIPDAEGGCASLTGVPIKFGQPVGVADINQDGGADDTRFIDGAITWNCTGANGPIEVPVNLDNTYWQPSGDQNKPAMGGFDALGPAIVLSGGGVDSTGRDHGSTLPSNASCTLQFAETVVDKTGIQVCAPPDGDITQDCSPGDMSEFHFETEILEWIPISFQNAAMGVPRNGPMIIATTTPLLDTTVIKANITITEDTGGGPQPFTAFTPALNMSKTTVLFNLDIDGDGTPNEPNVDVLAPNATYTITLSQSITDSYDQPHPSVRVFTFTTGN